MTYVWQGGRSARSDVSKKARTVYMPDQYSDWLPRKSVTDMDRIDLPQDNILCSHIYGKPVWFGATQPATAKKAARLGSNILGSNFSTDEIRRMKNVYVDVGGTNSQRCAGMTCFLNQGVAVLVGSRYASSIGKFESVLTHEFIHVRRFFDREFILDNNDEEKRTELERMARVKYPLAGVLGYYAYAEKTGRDPLTVEERMVKDRIGMTGGLSRNMKGRAVVKRAKEYYPESEIRKIHFSPPEKIDRYFDVNSPVGQYSVHVWYPNAPKHREVNYDLGSVFGSDARVFEWHNGKRIAI